MGVSRSVLIEEAHKILEIPLKKAGYEFEPSHPNGWGMFWFEKKLQQPTDMFYIIEFQPSGFDLEGNYFDIAVNLYRRTKRDELGDEIKDGPPQIWALRLRPRFWGETGPDSGIGTWWHFISIEELRGAYEDILEKLKKYVIPFLEDPNSTWHSGMGL
jgi:hypothetical protein